MPKNVLVLNDSEGSLTPLIESLAKSGYTPYSTHNSEQCFDLFDKVNASTLLLSLKAHQALKPLPQIRQDPDGATIPILFFGTGAEEITGNLSAHKEGGDCYFEHPFNLGEVVNKVRSFVGTGEGKPVAIPGSTTEPRAAELPPPLQLNSLETALEGGLIPGNGDLANAASALLDRIYQKETIDGEAKIAAECQRTHLETQLQERKEATRERLARLQSKVLAEPAPPMAEELKAQLEQLQHENFETTTLHQIEQERRQGLESQLLVAEESQNSLTTQVNELSSALSHSHIERDKAQKEMKTSQQQLSERLLTQAQELERLRQQTLLSQREAQKAQDLQRTLNQKLEEQLTPPAPPPASTSPSFTGHQSPPSTFQQSPETFVPAAAPLPVQSPTPRYLAPGTNGGQLTSQNSIPELLLDACETLFTGSIQFQRAQDITTVFFEAGKPINAWSNLPQTRLEERLYRAGKLDHDCYQRIRTSEAKSARLLTSDLVALGQIKSEELFTILQDYLTESLYDLFEWEASSYHVSDQRAQPRDQISLTLNPPGLLMEGIRRKFLLPRMISVVGSPKTIPGAPRPDLSEKTEELLLTPTERRLLPLINGVRTVEELVVTTGLAPLKIYHVLTALLTISSIEILVPGTEPCDTRGNPTSDSIDKRRIEKKFKQIHNGDYFEILGLNQSSTPHEIERAYERLMEEFGNRTLSAPISAQYRRELNEIRQVFDDARFVLLNPQTNQSYSRNL